MPVVHLGNTAAVHGTRDEETGRATVELPGNRVTTVTIPDTYTRQEAIRTVWHPDGLWVQHSTAAGPAWVECDDDPELASALGIIYGCPVGRPEDWETAE